MIPAFFHGVELMFFVSHGFNTEEMVHHALMIRGGYIVERVDQNWGLNYPARCVDFQYWAGVHVSCIKGPVHYIKKRP